MPLDQWREEKLAAAAASMAVLSAESLPPTPIPPISDTTTPAPDVGVSQAQSPDLPTAPSPDSLPTAGVETLDSATTASNTATTNTTPPHNTTNTPQPSPVDAKETGAIPPKSNSTANGSSTKKYRKDRYNYASAECGAKVLAANPEARVQLDSSCDLA